ncbi:MAG TPA: 4Fe-4S dicluster domain-containing protein [Proteobacteria bacterium]|nr:4Fe-4S dicluster domain-containing protein [Pseudomonadota bacterium]
MPSDLRKINAKECVGCRICELVCSLKHYGVINPQRSRIRVYRLEDRDKIETCRFCDNPRCVDACPTGAMHLDDGRAVHDREKCILCGACIEACPFAGSLRIFEEELLKCDLCGGDPECVKYCPTDALTLGALKEVKND